MDARGGRRSNGSFTTSARGRLFAPCSSYESDVAELCGREGRESCGLRPGGPRLRAGCDYHSVRPGCAVRYRSTGPRHMSWRRACGRQLRLPALGRVLCAAEETKLGPKWASGRGAAWTRPCMGPLAGRGHACCWVYALIYASVYVYVCCVSQPQLAASG